MRRTLIKGLRNLRWLPDPSRIVIRSVGAEPLDVCLTNRWSLPRGEPRHISAAAKVLIEPGASVNVIFETSIDGYAWTPKATSTKDGILQLDVLAARKELYTRLRISGEPARTDAPLAAIDWIEVRAVRN